MEAEWCGPLNDHLAAMVALERSVELRAGRLLETSIDHQTVTSVLERIGDTSHDRAQALAARLAAIAPSARTPEPVAATTMLEALAGERDRNRASAALVAAHALMTEAAMGYAVLLELAFRAADSIEHLGPENTGDLAWGHLRSCVAVAREIARAIPYVVTDELEQLGLACRCECPTCGLGVCGCPLAFRRRLDLASAEAGPMEDWPGLRMVHPRPGSPAAEAGMVKGDLLLSIGGKVLDSIPGLQESITAHGPGDAIEFEVRRVDGTRERIAVVLR